MRAQVRVDVDGAGLGWVQVLEGVIEFPLTPLGYHDLEVDAGAGNRCTGLLVDDLLVGAAVEVDLDLVIAERGGGWLDRNDFVAAPHAMRVQDVIGVQHDLEVVEALHGVQEEGEVVHVLGDERLVVFEGQGEPVAWVLVVSVGQRIAYRDAVGFDHGGDLLELVYELTQVFA